MRVVLYTWRVKRWTYRNINTSFLPGGGGVRAGNGSTRGWQVTTGVAERNTGCSASPCNRHQSFASPISPPCCATCAPRHLVPRQQSLCYVFSLFVCSLTYEVLSRLCLSLHHWKRYVCLSSFDRRWIFNWLAWQSMARVHWLIRRFADHSIFLCLP